MPWEHGAEPLTLGVEAPETPVQSRWPMHHQPIDTHSALAIISLL